MRRGLHIAVTLLAVVLLMRPFDCFAGGASPRKAASCCTKGKCLPTPTSDQCCKTTIPGGNNLVTSKAADHSPPALDVVTTDVPGTTSQPLVTSLSVEVHAPPGSPPNLRLSLPLLILPARRASFSLFQDQATEVISLCN